MSKFVEQIIIAILTRYYIITLGEENDIYNYLKLSIRYMVFFKNIQHDHWIRRKNAKKV